MTNTATNTLPVWFVVAAWATLSVVLNVLGVLANQPDEPPIALLVSVIGPTNTICYRVLFVRARSQSFTMRSQNDLRDCRG
jgi:low temperature requirement protein LtrA